MNADELGYRYTDTDTNDLGTYGAINPGLGVKQGYSSSGAGHGGSGGRPSGNHTIIVFRMFFKWIQELTWLIVLFLYLYFIMIIFVSSNFCKFVKL